MQALRGVTRVPTIYAVATAGLVLWLGVPLPDVIVRPIASRKPLFRYR